MTRGAYIFSSHLILIAYLNNANRAPVHIRAPILPSSTLLNREQHVSFESCVHSHPPAKARHRHGNYSRSNVSPEKREKERTRSKRNPARVRGSLAVRKRGTKNEAEERNPENDNGAARGKHITSYFLTWEQFAGDAPAAEITTEDKDKCIALVA